MLKVAVIGTGNMGKHHARNYFEHKDAELVAICDMNKEIADSLAEKYNCKAYYDIDELLEKEQLDGVTISVPTTYHAEVVEKVANKKINILLEKPVAENLEDSIIIKDLIKKNEIKCVVGHIERYNPALRKALDMVFDGKLGKILYIDGARQGPYPKAQIDVDILTDLGIHDLEIINYLLTKLNDNVDEIFVFTNSVISDDENKDIARVLLKTTKNVIINLSVDRLTPDKRRKIFICGEKGLLLLNYITQELVFHKNGEMESSYEYSDILKGISVGSKEDIVIDKKEPLFIEIDNFLKTIEGKETAFVNIEDAIKGIELLEKIKDKY